LLLSGRPISFARNVVSIAINLAARDPIYRPNTSDMTTELPVTNGGIHNGIDDSTFTVKAGLARMLQGGVIMDVVNVEQV
jgi:SOR/SNZ family